MIIQPDDMIKLLIAILVGGLIGAEREFRDKSAGFRTIIFICVGATLFTIFSIKLGGEREPSRIAANIVSGVGFLGAGAILRGTGRIIGLTTASTIWLAAGLGMGIGGGYIMITIAATVIILVVLWIFPFLERAIYNIRQATTYEIVCPLGTCNPADLRTMIDACELRVSRGTRIKSDGDMILTWTVVGNPRNHERLVEKLFAHDDIRSFKT